MGIISSTDLVTPDITRFRHLFVNLYLVGTTDDWVLVDAGLPAGKKRIIRAARTRFGNRSSPKAIVLTHGHFDHVGSLKDLIKRKDIPVYTHELELPHLTGRAHYPPMEPRAGGGAMALLSVAYPTDPINLHDKVLPLPDDGTIPEMPGWRWIHTPGHTAGHVSLFRDSDRALIAGDAFITTVQESALSVAIQRKEISGPPAYATTDWAAARASVRALADLNPSLAATGHGPVMVGAELHRELNRLATDFDQLAIPEHGRYVVTARPSPAADASSTSTPMPAAPPTPATSESPSASSP